MNKVTDGMLSFIDKSKTSYHAVAEIKNILLAEGFSELYEQDKWELCEGGKYFVIRGGSSIVAFVNRSGAFMAVASHSDSPCFRVKGEVSSKGALRLDVEKYGGTILYTWFDRPLSVAGRATVRAGNSIDVRLCDIGEKTIVIPSLAIHMQRDVNDGFKPNAAKHLQPIAAIGERKEILLSLIAESMQVKKEDILSFDLCLYNAAPATYTGLEDEMVLSSRIDNLGCAYTSLRAFLDGECADTAPILAVFDNEEVGSETEKGAASDLLRSTLLRICGTDEEYSRRVASGFLVSADNAHAIHPNYPEMSDGENAPQMGGGVVIKYNANKAYTTDAVTDGIFREICKSASVPVQSYYVRADMRGGSTLGSISAARVPFMSVDIGMPQLAMHSCSELMAAADVEYMYSALRAFYSKKLTRIGTKITVE